MAVRAREFKEVRGTQLTLSLESRCAVWFDEGAVPGSPVWRVQVMGSSDSFPPGV